MSGVLVVVVTTRGGSQQGYVDEKGAAYDFVSRCFAPWINIAEDPVTGQWTTAIDTSTARDRLSS